MQTYNIVNQGADNTGNREIDPILDGLIDENTTIVFPPGTYVLNELVVYSGVDNLHLIAPNGARLVPGQSGDNIRWIDVYSLGFVLDGFELDMRNTAIPPFVRMNYESGDWELKRLITRGKVRAATDSNIESYDSSDARTYFRLSAADGTRGLLQDCYFHEGACEPDEAGNRRAILVESGKGELVFNRCWFELWAENTIYAKKPEGPIRIYNCFQRNTQVGMRLGGNSEVRNCVSIKNDAHPIQAWSGGSLQRGVNVEATVPADPSQGINSYDGTITIADSDFHHHYSSSSCGGAITATTPCENIDVQNVRISYDSEKSQDAIYTLNGRMNDGGRANLVNLGLQNIQVRNDHDYQYAVSIGQIPDEWETVAGVLGGEGSQTDSSYVRDHVIVNGTPTSPDTRPPLPDPPELGQIPMQSAQVVRIDNQGNESESSYQITAGASVLPAGDDGATVAMDWGPDDSPLRPTDSQQAAGTVPPGDVHVFYVSEGIVSTAGSGPAIWSVDGIPFTPGESITTATLSTNQPDDSTWQQVDESIEPMAITVAKPLSHEGPQPAHVRLRNSTENAFEYKIEEWDYLDGAHSTETFHTLSVSPAEQQLELDNGSSYRMKAGTVSTTDEFFTRSLNGFFSSETPVILTQTQTTNRSDPIVTRLKNVSSDSFDVQIQESEKGSGYHVAETVGYIALEQGTGYLNRKPFEVQRTARTVADDWFYISFEQTYDTPRFIADLQTYRGPDPVSLRYRNLSSTGVEVKVDEETSKDSEVGHTEEVVGYAVFEGATLSTAEISNNQSNADLWHQFESDIDSSRVVIAKPLSSNGLDPAHIRLRNSTGNFEYKIEEWEYLDGTHTDEAFHTLAIERGDHELLLRDGSRYLVKSGTVSTSSNPITHSFNFFNGERPVVFAQTQTYNGYESVVTRISDVSSNSFDLVLQEEEASSDDGFHKTETVGYIALQEMTGDLNGSRFEVHRTRQSVNDQWSQITFEQKYESPHFIADMQTLNGSDTAQLRYRNLSSTGVEIKVEEEQSANSEISHTTEVVGYAVFDG